jgi:glycosyltransferase involved in cell wall biosynthesis
VRVLIVLPQPPSPEGGAAARCTVALIRGLAAHGVRVRALAAHHGFTPPHPVPDDLPVEVMRIDAPRSASRSLLERMRRPLSDLASPAFAARLRALVRDADVVHFDQVESAHDGPCADRPSAVHLQHRVSDNPMQGGWRPGALAHRLELALAERRAIARFPWLIANSPVVARSMAGAHPVTVAPLSLDVAADVRAALDGPPRLGIIGTAAWPPTAVALRRLATLWPAIRARVPRAELHVAGRGTRALLAGTTPAGIELVDEVASATAFLCGLSALVYPATRGSGTKVKTLESMAVGLPVITTPAGAEGIAPNDGVHVCRDDAALVERAAALLVDEGERRARGAAARLAFERDHTPARAALPLVELYRRMVGG